MMEMIIFKNFWLKYMENRRSRIIWILRKSVILKKQCIRMMEGRDASFTRVFIGGELILK